MDAQAIEDIQTAIVRAVAGNVTDVMEGEWGDRQWVHLFVDFEIDQDGTRSSSISFALAHRPRQPLEKLSFRLTRDAKQGFNQLAEAMRKPGEDRWSKAQLRIGRDGRFAFEFSHDPPWRLGGKLIDKRFEDYLDRWLETEEGAPFRDGKKREPAPALGWWRRLLGTGQ